MSFPRHLRKLWGKLRGWKCENCGRRWADGFLLEFHHKLPTSAGGKDTEDNAQLLCIECHYLAHKELEREGVGHKSASIVLARLRRTKGRWR